MTSTTRTITSLCDSTTITTDTDGLEISIKTAIDSPTGKLYTREHRFASIMRNGAYIRADMSITLDNGGYRVTWTRNAGNGWQMGKRLKALFGTEQEARIACEPKWSALVAWCRSVTPRPVAFQPDFTCGGGR